MKPLTPLGTLAVACSIFFAVGVVMAGISPSLKTLAGNAGADLVVIGSLTTALFFGGILSQLAAGPLSDRIGQRPIILGGALLLGGGVLGVTLSRWLPLTLACAVVAGFGQGSLIVTNVLIARLFPARSVSMLNLLNVFYGVGAVAGPAIASGSLRAGGPPILPLWVGAGLTLLLAPLIGLMPAGRDPQAAAPSTRSEAPSAGQVYRSPMLWALGGLLLVYVGLENAVGNWATDYLERAGGLSTERAALAASGFWLALTVGRLLGALLGARLAPRRLLAICLGGALLGGMLFAASGANMTLSIGSILLLGLCFGPVFPTSLALATGAFARSSGTALSILVGVGNGGGVLLPWLFGALLINIGPQAGATLVLAGTLAMLAIHGGIGLAGRQRRALARANNA